MILGMVDQQHIGSLKQTRARQAIVAYRDPLSMINLTELTVFGSEAEKGKSRNPALSASPGARA